MTAISVGVAAPVRIPAKMITGHNNGMIAPTTAVIDSLNERRFSMGILLRTDWIKIRIMIHAINTIAGRKPPTKRAPTDIPVIPPRTTAGMEGGTSMPIAEAAETMDTDSSDL